MHLLLHLSKQAMGCEVMLHHAGFFFFPSLMRHLIIGLCKLCPNFDNFVIDDLFWSKLGEERVLQQILSHRVCTMCSFDYEASHLFERTRDEHVFGFKKPFVTEPLWHEKKKAFLFLTPLSTKSRARLHHSRQAMHIKCILLALMIKS